MSLRAEQVRRLRTGRFDVLVLGAGINGAVSAAALAAAGGARVALIDAGDYAGGTSQQSSNLAWGGIKYLESWELALVRDLCLGRNRLMRSYPGMVREIRFLATIERGFRYHPLALLAGAWLYWLFGNGRTRAPRLVRRAELERRFAVVQTAGLAGVIEYSDAFLYDNDARFVYDFVHRARRCGAVTVNYLAAERARRVGGVWRVEVRDAAGNERFPITADVLVNAAGPRVDALNRQMGVSTRHRHVFSKGVHLVVPQVSPADRVLAFFADDGRLFFAIPMGARTCLGTTDTRVRDPNPEVTDEDRDYLLDNANRRLHLSRPLTRGDIIAERCGVRPLVVEGQGPSEATDFLQLSRRHVIELANAERQLSIFGGKLTDCLNVGEEVRALAAGLGVPLERAEARWYGEDDGAERAAFFERARRMGLDRLESEAAGAVRTPEKLSERLWRRYGAEAGRLLEAIAADVSLAARVVEGASYRRCELAIAAEQEMVVTLEDWLRRRSRIALVVPREVLRDAPGIREACATLFADEAEAEHQRYFGQ